MIPAKYNILSKELNQMRDLKQILPLSDLIVNLRTILMVLLTIWPNPSPQDRPVLQASIQAPHEMYLEPQQINPSQAAAEVVVEAMTGAEVMDVVLVAEGPVIHTDSIALRIKPTVMLMVRTSRIENIPMMNIKVLMPHRVKRFMK